MTSRGLVLGLASLCAFSGCSGGGAGSNSLVSYNSKSANPPLLYSLGSATESSTAASTPAPGALGLNSLNLTFTATGQANAVLVYETAFTGTFTVASLCTNATGAASGSVPATALFAGASTATGPGAVLTVTSGATGGTCTFTVTDGGTGQVELFVGNTLTGGTIN